jgi:hypothetical protein
VKDNVWYWIQSSWPEKNLYMYKSKNEEKLHAQVPLPKTLENLTQGVSVYY